MTWEQKLEAVVNFLKENEGKACTAIEIKVKTGVTKSIVGRLVKESKPAGVSIVAEEGKTKYKYSK